MSRLLARRGNNAFFTLPSSLRQTLYHRTQNAHVQQCRTRPFTTFDPAGFLATGPYTLMTGLHAIGLPWWTALPASALAMRYLVYRLFMLPYRRGLTRRITLQPLIDARLGMERRKLMRDFAAMSWSTQRLYLLRERYFARQDIGKLFGATTKFRDRIGGFLILMTVSEAVRRMCGARDGLLTLLLGPFTSMFGSSDKKTAQSSGALNNVSSDTVPTPLAGAIPSNTSVLTGPGKETVTEASAWFQPSLLDGGPFWCSNLTEADPSLILPFVFSGAFMAAILFAPGVGPTQPGDLAKSPDTNIKTPESLPQRMEMDSPTIIRKLPFLQRCFLAVAALSIFPALQMPSALLIYFISNIGISMLQTRRLANILPVRLAPMACRRPVRINPQKERVDVQSAARRVGK